LVLAGNTYADDAWKALLAALDASDWHVGGRQLILRVLSPDLVLYGRRSVWVEYLGWRSPAEALGLMAEADAAYIPYWFEGAYAEVSRLCFPSKLTAYLLAGLPILYHGPAGTAVSGFMTKWPLGVSCNTTSAAGVAEALHDLLADPTLQGGYAAARERLLREEFGLEVARERLTRLLGTGDQQDQ